MANFRVYYQDCPTVSIKDCNESAMVRDTIKKSMERKRFVVKDENDTIICLVRFVIYLSQHFYCPSLFVRRQRLHLF